MAISIRISENHIATENPCVTTVFGDVFCLVQGVDDQRFVTVSDDIPDVESTGLYAFDDAHVLHVRRIVAIC